MTTFFAILLIVSSSAEVIDLGTITPRRAISIHWPPRSDVVGLEMTFIPSNPPTNAVTFSVEQGHSIVSAEEIPRSVPDGPAKLALRWRLAGDTFSDYRMARMDLWRSPVAPPIVVPIHILEGAYALVSVPSRGVVPDSALPDQHRGSNPPPSALSQAVSDAFRKPIDPLPPLPPATNGMQRKFEGEAKPVQDFEPIFIQTLCDEQLPTGRNRMMQFYREGGQKGRR